MVTNSNFSFTKNTTITLELPFSEHIEELRQRLFLLFWIILFLTTLSFLEVKTIVKIVSKFLTPTCRSLGAYAVSTAYMRVDVRRLVCMRIHARIMGDEHVFTIMMCMRMHFVMKCLIFFRP